MNACRAAYDAAVVVRAVAGLVAFCALVGGAAGAAAPTLAISATGYLGFPDTVVIAVSNPSSRLEIRIPDGYGFPLRRACCRPLRGRERRTRAGLRTCNASAEHLRER